MEKSCVPSHVAVFLSLGVGGNVSEVFLWFLGGVDQCVQTFVGSLIEASLSRRRYWFLSITTTPEPLSGLEIIMSSLLLRFSRALSSALGGVGPFFAI